MGSSRWDPDEWSTYSSSIAATPIDKVYTTTRTTASKVVKEFLPVNFKFRESCDSTLNPESTPVIVAIDVTGSMGKLAETIVREGLGVVVEELYKRKPVSDPHLLLMTIGDAECGDQYPIQATQFEADMRLVEQLTKLYVEGGGGGNRGESYNLAWYFAANRTKIDSFLNRKKKGYLFTVGDEAPLKGLSKEEISKFFGDAVSEDINNRELLTAATKQWDIFHLIVDEDKSVPGAHSYCHGPGYSEWSGILGERAMVLKDHRELAEVIVSTIQVNEGSDKESVIGSWSGSTQLVVRNAVAGLTKVTGATAGVKRL